MTDQSDQPAPRAKADQRARKARPDADSEAHHSRPLVEHHLEQAGAGDWLVHLDRARPDPDTVSAEPCADPTSMHG